MTRRTLPPHCYQKPAGIYFQRRGCQTVRIVAAPGTAEFAAEYALALRGLTIAAQPNGRPTSYRGAADLVMAVRAKIGAQAFDLHSLRYTVVRELAEAGCSDDLIMAVTGHTSREMVALYAGQSRQKVRAIEAQGRRK